MADRYQVRLALDPDEDPEAVARQLAATYRVQLAEDVSAATGEIVILTEAIAGESQSRTFQYDGAGLLIVEKHPESGTTSYSYDARGHVTQKATAATVLQFGYDQAERLLTA